jgi:LPS export ABC transporter protein LptC
VSGLQRGLLLAMLLGGLVTLWLNLYTLHAADTSRHTAPELYIDRPHWQIFDARGRLERELRAARLEKSPADARARLTEPRLELVERDRQRWQADARAGWIDEDRHQLNLEQQVRLQRAAPSGGLTLATETLRIAEGGGLIETDRPVVLTSGNWHFTATGLRAELGRQQLQLLENVRGIHD